MTAVATLGLTAATMAQVTSYVPTNGLVGWWPFNGNANDESGNSNNGTVNGATLTTDRFGNSGKAYSFDGVDDIIPIILSQELTIDWSLNLWFNKDNLQTFISENVVGFGIDDGVFGSPCFGLNGQGAGQCPLLIQNPEKIYLFDGTSECDNVDVTVNYERNQWYNIIIVKQNNDISLFIDGNPISTNSTLVFNNFTNLILGNRDQFNFQFFSGKLDDIGIWNRALTDQEISDLYNANICYEFVTVTDTLVINTGITGYNPITYLNTLKIWPNPSNDHITIDAGNLATMNGYSIKIEDAQGQQVFQNAVNQQQFYVDITTWGGNGLYFVRIIDPQGNTVDIKKIVLQ